MFDMFDMLQFKMNICRLVFDRTYTNDMGLVNRECIDRFIANERPWATAAMNESVRNSILSSLVEDEQYLTVNPTGSVSNANAIFTLTEKGKIFIGVYNKTNMSNIKWISVADQIPPLEKDVLLWFRKGSKSNYRGRIGWFVTQGFLRDDLARQTWMTQERIKELGFGKELVWYDYAGRQIQNTRSASKNKVTHWAELEFPE